MSCGLALRGAFRIFAAGGSRLLAASGIALAALLAAAPLGAEDLLPQGEEFRVNTYTTSYQWDSSASSNADGDFVVVWESYLQDGSRSGVLGQRYQSSGAPLGAEFRVNTYTTDRQYQASVSSDADGDFVVVWQKFLRDGSSYAVFGQRFISDTPTPQLLPSNSGSASSALGLALLFGAAALLGRRARLDAQLRDR